MVLRLALRYSFSASNRHRGRVLRIVLSTAFSVAVLISVISVMDYLQGTRLRGVRDVRSFDAVVQGDVVDELSIRFPDASIFPYAEEDALVSGKAYSIRYIDSSYDGGIEIIGDASGIAVPYSFPSDAVEAVMLSEGQSGAVLPLLSRYSVTGRYSSALGYEFDSCHMFLPLSSYSGNKTVTAIKGIGSDDAKALASEGFPVTTWKEAEAGLYSALLIEKVMMYLVLSLLFVVILVSLRSSIRIFLGSKRGEMAELLVLGMMAYQINISFVLAFTLILLAGLASGSFLAIILMPLLELALQSYGLRHATLSLPGSTLAGLSAMLLAIAAAIAANEERKIWRMEPKEVLFDE